MKKIILAVFAHPDDEAFGPSGTLLSEAAAGTEVHLVTLTAGEAGANPDNHPDLRRLRLEEWRSAGQLIGARSMTHLGFIDSQLTNQSMIEIGDRLITQVKAMLAEAPTDCQLEIMSMDLNGISGHIDHIVASRASHYAFYRLKTTDPRLTRLRLACVPRTLHPSINTDWLFMEAGRDAAQIDEVIDARQHRDTVLAIMRAHASQAADAKQHIANRGDDIGVDHFIVKT